MYHKTLTYGNNSIVRDSDKAWIPLDMENTDYKEFEQWAIENNTSLEQLPTWPQKPQEDIIQEYYQAMRQLFDDVAKQKDYDDAMSIASYYASTNVQWAQESQTFIAWRDACWNVALHILDEVQTGTRSAPSIADFLNELPIIQWS